MGVTDATEKGTRPEAEEQPKGSSPAESGTPGSEGKESPEKEPQKLYTQADLDAMVHAAKSEAGRKAKEVERERDNLKTQLSAKEGEIEDIQFERETLQKQIEDLSSDDPKKFDLIQKDKQLRDEQRSLKAGKQALEADKQAHQEDIRIATETMREINIWDVASEYEGGDAVRLKALADTMEKNSLEEIRGVAEILWKPKGTKPKGEEPGGKQAPLKPYSGHTDGGQLDFSKLTPSEKLQRQLEKEKKR